MGTHYSNGQRPKDLRESTLPLALEMMAWENGTLEPDETVMLFQSLIDSGLAWKLQGCYGRMARTLIAGGYCHE